MSDSAFSPQDFGVGRLFRHVRDAVVVANARTERIVLWNDSAGGMFGYDESEALQIPLHALVPDDLRQRHRAGLAAYQETGGGSLIDSGNPVELQGVHKSGRLLPIELTLTRIPETSPEGDRFALAIIRDVSERKSAEASKMKLQEAATDRRRALELNDTIVQGLTVAKLALEHSHPEVALRAVTETLEKAQAIVARLLGQIHDSEGPLRPGDLMVRGEDHPTPAPD